nr:adenylate/guanylate cyclase domain-containing protein [Paenibacillus hamazuiensis]
MAVSLLAIAAALVLLGVLLIVYRDEYGGWGFRSKVQFHHVSMARTDARGGVSVISDSRQSLRTFDADGTLRYTIHPGDRGERTMSVFTEAAADSQGRLYVLTTVLDYNGLAILSEEIERYLPDGRPDSSWKPISRPAAASGGQAARMNAIRSLQLKGDELFYYELETANSAVLRRVTAPNGTKSDTVLQLALDSDIYPASFAGTEPGSIVFSTKRGELYRVMPDGKPRLLLRGSGDAAAKGGAGYAEQPIVVGGVVYFIDNYGSQVKRLPLSGTSAPELWLQADKLTNEDPDADFQSIHPGQDGSIWAATPHRVLRIDRELAVHPLEYSVKTMAADYAYWAAAAAFALLLLVLLKLLLFDVAPFSIMYKQIFVYIPLVLVCMLALAGIVTYQHTKNVHDEVRRGLVFLAHDGQKLVQTDKLESIGTPGDYMSPAHAQLAGSLAYADGFSKFYRVLYKIDGDQMRVVHDEDIASLRLMEPNSLGAIEGEQTCQYKDEQTGAVYPMTDFRLLLRGEYATCQYVNEKGNWLYALGPLFDTAGKKVVGVYEVGIHTNALDQRSRQILVNTLYTIAAVALAMLGLFVLVTTLQLSSIRELRDGVIAMTRRSSDLLRVNVRGKDEIATLAESFNRMAETIRGNMAELHEINKANARFVPDPYLKFLGKNSFVDIKLGDQVEKPMVMLNMSIHSFYAVAKQLDTKQNFDFINAFLQEMVPVVHHHKGIIDKYLDAGLLALFPQDAGEALRCAIALRERLYRFNEASPAQLKIDTGIGLHFGTLLLGIIGEEERRGAAVLSDNVQITAMLEAMTQKLETPVLITDSFYEQLGRPQTFLYRNLGMVHFEGRSKPIHLIDVYEGDTESQRKLKHATKAAFERAVGLYQIGHFEEARELFLEVIKRNQGDKPAKLYFFQCDRYLQNRSKDGWNGTLYA